MAVIINDELDHNFFASIFAFILGVFGIIISLLTWNQACEHALQQILFAACILVLVTFFLERLLYHQIYPVHGINYIFIVLLTIASVIVGGIILGIYVFTIDPTNHVCNNLLYWTSFVTSIILLASIIFIIPILSLNNQYYIDRRQAAI